MPNILFASNSVSHFPGSGISAVTGLWDSSRVPYAIETYTNSPVASPALKDSTTEETWVHFRHTANSWYTVYSDEIIEGVDPEGNRIFKLLYRPATSWGYTLTTEIEGSTYNQYRYLPILTNGLRTYDICYRRTALTTAVEVYVNEFLILKEERNITSVGPQLRNIWLGGGASNNGQTQYWSEIIVADGDTRNARLDLLRPVSGGHYDQWGGFLSALADDDPTTGMTTTQDNQKQSTVLSPYGGAENISNIVQVTTSVRGLNSPEKLAHFIRMSGVDYEFSEIYDVPESKDFQVTDWTLNPGTSLPWSSTDLGNIEFGFESKP